jgi:hypothetical protein
VLDEGLAWKFSASWTLAGMEDTIGGKPFIIAGVILPGG